MTKEARILVVDDEPAVRTALRYACADEPGWFVDGVSTGEEALARLAAASYDVALVDKNLPGMSGMELLERIRTAGADLHVYVMTGYPSVETAVAALNLGVDGYLEKPFRDIYAVIERLRTALAVRERAGRAPPHPAARSRASGGRSLRVVAASPVDEARARVASLLGTQGHEVEGAATALALFELLGRAPVDVVFLHAALDPTDLVRRVARQAPASAILVAADQLHLVDVVALVDAGTRALIDAPIGSAEFASQLNEALLRLITRGRPLALMRSRTG